MGKKHRKGDQPPTKEAASDRAGASGGGLGASLVKALAWFVGGFTRENALEWAKHLFIAVILILFVRWLFVEPFRIPSGSMRDTLLEGDRIFVNKLVYGIRVPFKNHRLWRGAEPERWDVVVFRSVERDAKHKTLVKRVVGLPGERIHIAHGDVYVNGQIVAKPKSLEGVEYTSVPGGLTDMRYGLLEDDAFSLVPADHYLLLGDNSAQSRDGRTFGWVPNSHILGRVSCIWWPVTRWRDFTGFPARCGGRAWYCYWGFLCWLG